MSEGGEWFGVTRSSGVSREQCRVIVSAKFRRKEPEKTPLQEKTESSSAVTFNYI
jgi:hypothetical protein